MTLSYIISETKQDIGRKSRFLILPCSRRHSYIRGPVEIYTVWYGQIKMARLPDGEKSLKICLAASTEYRGVAYGQIDGQTDRQTDILRRHRLRYADQIRYFICQN